MFEKIWNHKLFDLPGEDKSIFVNQVVLAVILVVVGLAVCWVVARFIGARLRRTRMNDGAALVFQKVLFYTLAVAIVFTAMTLLQIPITMFAFLGGAIAIGVGFGAQNIISNFISGWILMAERPVRLGDLIEVDDKIGRVEAIGARCTRVRRTDGIDMLVPNSVMLERTVINWTLIDQDIRTTVRVGVQYGSLTDQVAALIRQAVEEHERILPQPAPIIIFDDFGDNALIFDVYFWCQVSSEMELRQVRSDLRFRIDHLFRDADIIIAYPQRDVHLDTLRPLEVKVTSEKADAGT